MNLRFAAGIGEECRLDKLPGLWARLAIRLAATAAVSLLLLFGFSAHTSAQIILDGNLTEPDWKLLSQRSDGPSPGFGAGHEINALYADLDSSGLFIGVAGNVLWGTTGNRILVFIDSKPGGYNTGNFGRAGAPQGIDDFNELSSFDLDFFPDYVLVIGTDAANPNGAIPALANYYWDLYTLSSTADSDVGGGPNLPLGGKTDPDLGANPPVPGPTTNYLQGFETRLTYSQSGAGVDIAIDQPVIKFFAAYISDGGYLSNQFITPAFPTDGNYTDGQVNFAVAVPNPVDFAGYIVINEFDVDQPGEDNREFIELKNISNIPINLDPYSLRLVNGTGGGAAIYRTIDLPNVVLNPGQYYVVCGIPSNVANCNLDATPDVDLLENAVPSAIALVYPNSDTIIDTVSYGGSTVAPYTEGTGISPGDDDVTVGIGLSRLPDGADTNRNSIDFSRRCITPGQTNTTDNINCTGGGGTATPTPACRLC